MELHIFKNEDDYNEVGRNNPDIDYYVTTLKGYDYVIHGLYPFRYVNGLGEKHAINPMDIAKVMRTRDCVTVILNLDFYTRETSQETWNEILNS